MLLGRRGGVLGHGPVLWAPVPVSAGLSGLGVLGARAHGPWAGLRSMGQGTEGAAGRAPGGLGWGCPHWSFVFQSLFFLSRILPSPAFLFAGLRISFSISFVKGVKKGTDNLQLFSDSCFLLDVLMCLDVFVSLFNFHVSPVYPKKVTCSF